MTRPTSHTRKLLFAAVTITAAYLVLETLATAIAWFSWWDTSLWIFEDSGRTWRFDSVSGYRLTSTPSRFARITNGSFEFIGTARGNAQGFPDRDDFHPQRNGSGDVRIAVFGDSFTEAQYLGQNWPDRAEDLARKRGRNMELYNCAVSGGGLANWWSVLMRMIVPLGYELDGVVFVVYPGDLERTFSMWDHRGGSRPRFGRTRGWDPSTFPATLSEAAPLMQEHPGLILAPADFERTIQGAWPAGAERRLRPFFLTRAWRLLRGRGGPAQDDLAHQWPNRADPAKARLIADIAQFLKTRGLPALVIHVPERSLLLDPSVSHYRPIEEARVFAASIGAEFVDSTSLYSSMTKREIRRQFLPYDGHWSQEGSDRFAEFVVLQLLDRFPERFHDSQDEGSPK
jgi:hypothetical protein